MARPSRITGRIHIRRNKRTENDEMTRLETLKSELEVIKSLHTLCFDLKEKVIAYYEHEIRVIEEYGDE